VRLIKGTAIKFNPRGWRGADREGESEGGCRVTHSFPQIWRIGEEASSRWRDDSAEPENGEENPRPGEV